jgi:hypothetical protein
MHFGVTTLPILPIAESFALLVFFVLRSCETTFQQPSRDSLAFAARSHIATPQPVMLE